MTLRTTTSRSLFAAAIAALTAVASGAAVAGASTGASGGLASHLTGKPAATASTLKPGAGQKIGYAVEQPLCATTVVPHHVNCFALRLNRVAKGTPGAFEYVKPDVSAIARTARTAGGNALPVGLGPAGGLTPNDLAVFYDVNPNLNRKTQTVAIVNWFNDAHIKSDLAFFDKHYGFKKETASSFRVVNQKGTASPLPSSTKGKDSSGEISLDVETVRGMCRTCKIVLVEASNNGDKDIAAAENTAARLGATEINNSFGEPEKYISKSEAAAYNHPGVVITASTGDDGWFSWDFANNSSAPDTSANMPNSPSSLPTVVAVAGTELAFDNTAKRTDEAVWNDNGPDDQTGLPDGAQGASGGGCSTKYSAPAWQKTVAGYTATGCAGKRLTADVAADAAPGSGIDTYNTWNVKPADNGWATIGGTSLSSPLVASMYALAGGSGGAAYPARAVYTNATSHAFDVTEGGNGFCGGDTTFNCGNDASSNFSTDNPNGAGGGQVDCSFPRDGSSLASPPALSSECNAVPGFDGASGVGSPLSASLFTSTSPAVSVSHTKVIRLHKRATFTAKVTERLSSAHITGLSFNWGDGHSTSGTKTTQSHTYTKKGAYTVTVTVTDSAGQVSVVHSKVAIGQEIGLSLFGPRSLKPGHKGQFRAVAHDPNTGAKVTSIVWNWGDHHSSKGAKPTHAYAHSGNYLILITLKDSTGVVSRWKTHQKVS